MQILTPNEVRLWFLKADDEDIQDFLDCGLEALICGLEEEDYFGTEGFQKRYT